jgi:hypothetical protein
MAPFVHELTWGSLVVPLAYYIICPAGDKQRLVLIGVLVQYGGCERKNNILASSPQAVEFDTWEELVIRGSSQRFGPLPGQALQIPSMRPKSVILVRRRRVVRQK